MKRKLIVALILGIAVLFVVGLHAQTTKKSGGTIAGVVIGPDDKPVAHASIMYQSSGGNAAHATFTDSKGHFTITGLKQDDYDLRASANGIFSEWQKNVPVHKGQTKDVKLRLEYAKEMPVSSSTPPKKKP